MRGRAVTYEVALLQSRQRLQHVPGRLRPAKFMSPEQLQYAEQFVLGERWVAYERQHGTIHPASGNTGLRYAETYGCEEEREARARAMAAAPLLCATLVTLRSVAKRLAPEYVELIDEALGEAGIKAKE